MIKRSIPALLLTASLTIALAGCGYLSPPVEPRVTENRDIDEVTALVLKTSGDVSVTLGDEPTLTITARPSTMDLLTAEVNNGVLTLDVNGPHLWMGDVRYALTVPVISDITIDGSGDVLVDFTGADDITVAISGSGDVDGSGIDAASVSSSIRGSGNIELSGSADSHTVRIVGSGDVDGVDLETERAEVSITGSGDAAVNVTKQLDADISGSGDIRYTGRAKVSSSVTGSGSVSHDG